MRIALFVHGLPPHARTGVETHVDALARALAARGERVQVLAARSVPELPHLSLRRERRGDVEVHWLNLLQPPADAAEREEQPGVEAELARWLERERPQLVHVHHWNRLGTRFLAHGRRLGIPALYTAHDYHFACHRWTFLRPDLARCAGPGDPALCARCDLAQAYLQGLQRLGDFHLGALPDQLSEGERAELARRLEGEAPDLDRATACRRDLHAARERALAEFELILAPTERVAIELQRAGVAPRRVRLMPYAIELEALECLPPPLLDPGAPVRLGFLGGLSKHKGAHVLLEAFRGMAGRASLRICGDSSDRPYVERVRELCAQTGATFHGGYAAEELPRVLAQLDVVCVPSLWEENAPFVIREAFAAGRPVLASRTEALAESVRDGIDGLLLPQGDARAWREAFELLARDRERARSLAARVRPPPALAEQAEELVALYQVLLERARAEQPEELPAHLAAFEAARTRLEHEPLEALHGRVQAGLAQLRAALAPGVAASGTALDVARDLLRDARGRAAWLSAQAAQRSAEVGWQREQLDARQEELLWRRELLAQRDKELEWLRATLGGLAAERDTLAQASEELRARAAESAERGAALEHELETLARHEAWLRTETAALAAVVLGSPSAETLAQDPQRLQAELAQARARAESLRAELEWRREEMRSALRDGSSLFKQLLEKSALGRRFAGWASSDGGPS